MAGARALNPPLGEWLLRRSLKTSDSVTVAREGDWVFVSDSPEALRAILARAAGRAADEQDLLGNLPDFQHHKDKQLEDSLIWVFANIPTVASTAPETGVPAVKQFFEGPGIFVTASSWGWHSQGPHSGSYDLFAFSLLPEIAEEWAPFAIEGQPNFLDILLGSGVLLSPIYSSDHGGTVLIDLIAVDFLATKPGPPVAE